MPRGRGDRRRQWTAGAGPFQGMDIRKAQVSDGDKLAIGFRGRRFGEILAVSVRRVATGSEFAPSSAYSDQSVPNFPDADVWTARLSKLETRRERWQARYFKLHEERQRTNIALRTIALVVGLTALPFAVLAHFKLLEPAEWVKTSDLGDPQKAGPCGLPDTNGDNAKLLTDASTKVTRGSKLQLKIQETVFHSGHYPVALAVNSRCATRSPATRCKPPR